MAADLPHRRPGAAAFAWAALACAALACAVLTTSARAAEAPPGGGVESPAETEAAPAAEAGGAKAREDVDDVKQLRARVADLARRCEELGRRLEELRAPTRAAVEDYLEARGITGLAWTDRRLRPLDRTLRRGTVGAELRTRYELWQDTVDLDGSSDDSVDHSEIRARVAFGFAMVEGPEVELELQGLLRQGGLFELSALEGGPVVPPPVGSPGRDPVFALDGLDPDEEFAVRRAEVRLPAFNLLGRLAHVPVMLAAGRQEIAFGRGFFLGADDDGAGVTWDALRLWADSGEGGRVDVFAGRAAIGTRVVAAHVAGPVDPEADAPEIEVLGVRGETRGLLPDSMLAAYYVRADANRVLNTSANYVSIPPLELNTFGVEAAVELTTSARLRADAAVQWGDYGAQEIRDSGAVALGLEFGGEAARGRGSLYAAYGSGDRAGSSAYEGFIPLAQDRGMWDDLGALSSRNTFLWGFALARRTAREAELGVRFTQAFAARAESPAGFFMRGFSPGAGSRIGEIVSVYADWPLFGQEGSHLRIAWASLFPGDWFAPGATDAGQLRIEARFGF